MGAPLVAHVCAIFKADPAKDVDPANVVSNMSSLEDGVVVPMPMLPFDSIRITSVLLVLNVIMLLPPATNANVALLPAVS